MGEAKKIAVIAESAPRERRVALTPKSVRRLTASGFAVVLEGEAGIRAGFSDQEYIDAGAEIASSAEVRQSADVLLKVRPPSEAEAKEFRGEQILISLINPAQNDLLLSRLAQKNISSIALDCIPRTTRAQAMDVLSSMANLAGYRAVVEASHVYGSFFAPQFTAAGKIPPATVLVIGAGVAGLAAIGAARGLGAVVKAFDTRMAAAEQVESMGAEFLMLDFEESGDGGGGYAKVMSDEFIAAEMALFAAQAPNVDIVITTALIPGRPAPKLWLAEHVKAMKPGSVVVDLAAEQGGNCDCTKADELVDVDGVSVVGYTDLVSRMPKVASELFAGNIVNFMAELGDGQELVVDFENDVVRPATVTHGGYVTWPPPPPEPAPVPPESSQDDAEATQRDTAVPAAAASPDPSPANPPAMSLRTILFAAFGLLLLGGWLYLRFAAKEHNPELQQLLQHMTVFVLAVFVGWQVIWNVTAALHTPLMSVTNAISGIIIIGGMLQQGDTGSASVIIGAIATLFAAINVAGGFLVTQRMLAMFRK